MKVYVVKAKKYTSVKLDNHTTRVFVETIGECYFSNEQSVTNWLMKQNGKSVFIDEDDLVWMVSHDLSHTPLKTLSVINEYGHEIRFYMTVKSVQYL